MPSLRNSVGQNGVNEPDDVRIVQRLLNRFHANLGVAAPLVEDGIIGPKTLSLITAFQARMVGMTSPDGRVDPGGRTWEKLNPAPAASSAPPSAFATSVARPANVSAFIEHTLAAAQQVQTDWGVPVSICLAQAALESGWGQAVKDNAYFGIKGKSLSGQSTNFTTTEFINGRQVTIRDSFRAYADFAEAADDYGRFLRTNPRYQDCFNHPLDAAAFADSLQAAGYATDPQYAEKLKRVIRTYQLSEYDV